MPSRQSCFADDYGDDGDGLDHNNDEWWSIYWYIKKKTDASQEQFYILCKILYYCDAENDDDRADEFVDADKDYNEYDANDTDNSYCHGDNYYDHVDDNDDANLRMAFQDCVH